MTRQVTEAGPKQPVVRGSQVTSVRGGLSRHQRSLQPPGGHGLRVSSSIQLRKLSEPAMMGVATISGSS